MTQCLIKNLTKPKQLGLLTPCLTKSTGKRIDNRAFTLVELMMAVGFSVLLLTAVYGFYNASSQSYSSGITGQALQDGANILLSKIIEGDTESKGVFRLSTAMSYMIPNGDSSKLYFCQDSPCTGSSDLTARWYYLDNAGTTVFYHHPSSNNTSIEDIVYTAPEGSSLTLRFSPATSNPSFAVEVDVALTQHLLPNITNKRLASSGAASTFVLLRNHP